MELVVLKSIIELVAFIEYLKEHLLEYKIKLAAKLDIEKELHIIMEHIEVSVVGVRECKIVTIDVELELYRVIQAIEVVKQLEDIIKEKLEFNNMVYLLDFVQSRHWDIEAIKQDINWIMLVVKVEYIAVKEANTKLVVASKSMVANIVVFIMASKIS